MESDGSDRSSGHPPDFGPEGCRVSNPQGGTVQYLMEQLAVISINVQTLVDGICEAIEASLLVT